MGKDLAGNGFIKDAITREFSGLVIRDRVHNALRANGDADFTNVDSQVLELLKEVGITFSENSNNLIFHLLDKLGLSKEDFDRLPQTSESFPVYNIYKVLNDWIIAGGDGLKVVHGDFYKTRGDIGKPCYHMIDGMQIPENHGYLAFFQDTPHFIYFKITKQGVEITVDGDNAELFFKILNERYKTHLVRELKGKVINKDLKPITLKEYDRNELIYPKKLSREIDELLTSFRNWRVSDKIDRWGYILIGRPGTGKTTIGGMLAKLRSDDCTFIYCPAGEVENSRQLNLLFEMAKTLAPAILQIDDVDLISKHREFGESSLTSTLMENLDGLKENKKIFLLLTTNNPGNIEKAIINRAGRISGKVIFKGYNECLAELLIKGTVQYELNLSYDIIRNVVNNHLTKDTSDLTPDEAMNVCMRLHLLRGKEAISQRNLKHVLECVYDAFNNPEYEKCFLEYKEQSIQESEDD
jgi:AAA+ superfamily predicted ATPase